MLRVHKRGARIGGPDACEITPHSKPWMVGLYMGVNPQIINCGGSLIGSKFVLTAAHCMCDDWDTDNCHKHQIWAAPYLNLTIVSVGDHDDTEEDKDEEGNKIEKMIPIAHYFPHPKYTGNNDSSYKMKYVFYKYENLRKMWFLFLHNRKNL